LIGSIFSVSITAHDEQSALVMGALKAEAATSLPECSAWVRANVEMFQFLWGAQQTRHLTQL
jgi:hypothetical protein